MPATKLQPPHEGHRCVCDFFLEPAFRTTAGLLVTSVNGHRAAQRVTHFDVVDELCSAKAGNRQSQDISMEGVHHVRPACQSCHCASFCRDDDGRNRARQSLALAKDSSYLFSLIIRSLTVELGHIVTKPKVAAPF